MGKERVKTKKKVSTFTRTLCFIALIILGAFLYVIYKLISLY